MCSNETPSSHINTSCEVVLGLCLFTWWSRLLLEVAKTTLQLLGDDFTNTIIQIQFDQSTKGDFLLYKTQLDQSAKGDLIYTIITQI